MQLEDIYRRLRIANREKLGLETAWLTNDAILVRIQNQQFMMGYSRERLFPHTEDIRQYTLGITTQCHDAMDILEDRIATVQEEIQIYKSAAAAVFAEFAELRNRYLRDLEQANAIPSAPMIFSRTLQKAANRVAHRTLTFQLPTRRESL